MVDHKLLKEYFSNAEQAKAFIKKFNDHMIYSLNDKDELLNVIYAVMNATGTTINNMDTLKT